MKGVALVLLLVLGSSPPASGADADTSAPVAEQRWIHAEPSLGRTLLALPYTIVALTGWPLKKLLFWMEDVNLPRRIGDAVRHPAGGAAAESTP